MSNFGAEYLQSSDVAVVGAGPWKYIGADGYLHIYINGVWYIQIV